MSYFIAITEKIMVEGLARLFRDNVWKLHRLSKSVILDRASQFTIELMRKLNKMHFVGDSNKAINGFSSTNRQIDRMNESRVRTVSKDVHQS